MGLYSLDVIGGIGGSYFMFHYRELGEGDVRERRSLISYKTNCNLIEK